MAILGSGRPGGLPGALFGIDVTSGTHRRNARRQRYSLQFLSRRKALQFDMSSLRFSRSRCRDDSVVSRQCMEERRLDGAIASRAARLPID